jgi:hypothetical protein
MINPKIVVGSIFDMSWGYDQTNVNYFQVTRLSPSGVFVREIAGKSVAGTDGSMCCNVVPQKDVFLERSQWVGKKENGLGKDNSETFRRLKDETAVAFSIEGRYWARLNDGKPQYMSWYH